MGHRSSDRPATSRLRILLLAGGTAFCAAGTAGAEPIQPFWLMPTTLASGLGVEKTAAAEQLKVLKAKVSASRPVDLFTSNVYLRDSDTELDTARSFSDSTGETSPISLKLRSGSFDLEPSVGAKVERMAEGAGFSGAVATDTVGFDAVFLDGRISFSSDIAKTADEADTRDFRDPQLRESDRSLRLSNTSRRSRFAAKLIDSENLRLMVDSEFGQTSDGFASSLRELPMGRLVLPGSWSSVSSSLEFGEAKLSVDYKDFITREETLKRQGVTVGFASSALSIYRKEGMEFNLTQGGQWLRRTNFRGITADVLVADVLPNAIADAIDPIRPFLPTSVSGAFERGDIVRAELIPGPRDRVDTANVALTWDTSLGETTASVWERKIKTDIITPDGGEGLPLARSSDRFIDVSHKIRRGSWQFGAGLSLIETDDTTNGIRNSDSQIAPHVSVAYAPENGPKIELRFGAADAQSQIIDDNVAARAKTRQLQLSVDLSSFAQEEMNRADAKLKLEYRYDLNGSDRDPVSGRERGGGHAVLLTFSTPLN